MLFDTSYLRFLAASIAVHSAILLMLYPARSIRVHSPENITVSVLEPPATREPAVGPPREMPPSPAPEKPPVVAKPVPPRPRTGSQPAARKPKTEIERAPPAEPASVPGPMAATPAERVEERAADPAPRKIVPEHSIVAERQLPTVKELLPPLTWSSDSRDDTPVSLNTSDPVYVNYFTKIKQQIESHWQYPELALRYGLQGRLSLEFTIGANGQLERLRLVRSSGSQLLDEEAIRAIRAAAPFPPIPQWIKANPLSISAAMEYHDNRVDYRWAR